MYDRFHRYATRSMQFYERVYQLYRTAVVTYHLAKLRSHLFIFYILLYFMCIHIIFSNTASSLPTHTTPNKQANVSVLDDVEKKNETVENLEFLNLKKKSIDDDRLLSGKKDTHTYIHLHENE